MTDRLVTLEQFPTPEPAALMRNLLEAEGIQAFLADEAAVGMLWYLSAAMGGIKLQVAEADVARATQILESQRQSIAELDPEAFAAEAISSQADDDDPDSTDEDARRNETETEAVDSTDELASRAFRAAVIGLGFVPAGFYAAWLIGRLVFSSADLSDKASRRMWGAFALTFTTFLFWWILIRGPFRM